MRITRSRIWLNLVEPHHAIRGVVNWHRARLLASLLIFLGTTLLIGATSIYFYRGEMLPQIYYLLGLVVLIGIAYVFSRTRFFILGSYLALGALSAVGFAYFAAGGDDATVTLVSLVALSLILSGALLYVRHIIVLWLSNIAVLLVISFLSPNVDFAGIGVSLGLIIAIGVLVIVVTTNRNSIERERINEIAMANQELHNLREYLEQRVDERTAELEAKNNALETFAYSISHDLKSPLRGINGYSKLLLEDYHDGLNPEAQDYLQSIQEASAHMSQMIDDLLTYSRLQRRNVQQSDIQLSNLLDGLIDERSSELKLRDIQVHMDLECETVFADKEGVSQALRNLIDNAIKFTENSKQPTIEIGGRANGSTCIISVKDNGIGFDMKYHQRIFEIFQRLNRSEEYPGTGIGLALVSMAMERNGGRAWAESTPYQGATFFIELPTTN